MKKWFILSALALVVVPALAQRTINDPNAEKRNVNGYHAITVSDGIDLYLSQGGESVAVSASDTKYRDRIHTEVKDGVLKIWYEHSSVGLNVQWGNRKLKAYVSFNSLDKLSGSGGSDIKIEGSIKVQNLAIHISGGSDFDGKIEAESISIQASGGSDASISGNVKKLDIDASGGSDFKGYGLVSDVCSLEASGGSDVYITVNKELNANASGGSDVYYKGNGSVNTVKSSGSSSVKKVGS